MIFSLFTHALSNTVSFHSCAGDTVFSIGSGSGTDLVAAYHLKRHVVGFEVDKNQAKYCAFRLSQSVLSGSMPEKVKSSEMGSLVKQYKDFVDTSGIAMSMD